MVDLEIEKGGNALIDFAKKLKGCGLGRRAISRKEEINYWEVRKSKSRGVVTPPFTLGVSGFEGE